jgi:hypothetical protein
VRPCLALRFPEALVRCSCRSCGRPLATVAPGENDGANADLSRPLAAALSVPVRQYPSGARCAARCLFAFADAVVEVQRSHLPAVAHQGRVAARSHPVVRSAASSFVYLRTGGVSVHEVRMRGEVPCRMAELSG